MSVSYGVDVGCREVGDFIEQAHPPSPDAAIASTVRVTMVGDFVEQCDPEDRLKKFKVILKSDAQVVVFGHGLKPVVVGNDACVGVWRRSGGEEVLVALFPLGNTVGVFTGNVQVAS